MSIDRSQQRLTDMLWAGKKVKQFTTDMTRAEFDDDERTQYAVIALLEIVGEAAHHIDRTVRERYPQVPWRSLIGMRNHLIHGYNAVDLDIVWTAITQEIPQLIALLSTIVPSDCP